MKFAFLGNLQGNTENASEKEIFLITIQLIVSVSLIITNIVSAILTFDLFLKKQGKDPLFSDQTSKKVDVENRIFLVALVIIIIFINYNYIEVTRKKGKDLSIPKIQLFVSFLTLIPAIISLYMALVQMNKSFKLSDIENSNV